MKALTSARDNRLSDFEGLYGHIVKRYFAPGLDRDDLMQEARIGALKGLRDYDPSRGAALASFVARCAERQVQTAVTMATVGKHRPLNRAVSLDAPAPGEDNDDGTWYDAIPDNGAEIIDLLAVRERLHEIATLFRERLTDTELACLLGWLNDQSYEEISADLGIGLKTIDNALQRARAKLSGHRQPERNRAFGYVCPGCGGSTVKKPGRGRPPRCNVCRVAEARAAA